MFKLSPSKLNLWIGVLFAYILFQFAWWAYMLVDLHTALYEQQITLGAAQSIDELDLATKAKSLEQNLSGKIWMVLGEGSVFLFLLVLGFIKVKQSLAKEIAVAEEQTNFLHAVTHELNTPIAAVQLQAETLINRELDREKQKQILQNTLKEAKRLKVLVDNVMLSSTAENQMLSVHKEKIDLSTFLKTVLEKIKAANPALANRIQVTLDTTHIMADPNALESIFLNLIENFDKYVPSGSLKITANKQEIIFTDEGPGIPDAKKKKVLEKFIRLENEKTRKTKGTGLGLFIVHQLCLAHGWEVHLQDNQPKGLQLIMKLT